MTALAFAPDPVECDRCPPTGCNLACVWPCADPAPLLWEGDGA